MSSSSCPVARRASGDLVPDTAGSAAAAFTAPLPQPGPRHRWRHPRLGSCHRMSRRARRLRAWQTELRPERRGPRQRRHVRPDATGRRQRRRPAPRRPSRPGPLRPRSDARRSWRRAAGGEVGTAITSAGVSGVGSTTSPRRAGHVAAWGRSAPGTRARAGRRCGGAAAVRTPPVPWRSPPPAGAGR